jgi:hypothetical protein
MLFPAHGAALRSYTVLQAELQLNLLPYQTVFSCIVCYTIAFTISSGNIQSATTGESLSCCDEPLCNSCIDMWMATSALAQCAVQP